MRARIVMSVLIAGVLALVAVAPAGQRFEKASGLGLLYTLRGPVAPPPGALVIALDADSVGWLNRNVHALAEGDLGGCLTPHAISVLERARNINTLPRAVYKCLLRALAPLNPAAVVFDINFNADGPDDAAFAGEIAAHGNVVLLERVVNDGIVRRLAPSPGLAEAARAVVMFQSDGSNTEVAAAYPTRLYAVPDAEAMPLAALRLHGGAAPPAELPVLQTVWFYGPPGTIPTVNLRGALNGGAGLPPDLAGQVVFVGASDPGSPQTSDHFLMPSLFGPAPRIGGVEIAATAFLNLLQGRLPHRPGAAATGAIAFGAVLAIFLAGLLLVGRGGLLAVVTVTGVYIGLATALFWTAGGWLPVAVPVLIGAPLAFVLLLVLRYNVAREIVRRLAPRRLADELLSRNAPGRAAPRAEEASVMFIDLEGSTDMGTRLEADIYQRVMDGYYAVAAAEIEGRGGAIVEFKGDGILAIFPAAEAGPRHARAACEAAGAISRGIGAVDVHPELTGRDRLKLRFGLNSGDDLSLGAIGTATRFNFNAVGDTVNTASRLEQLGKRFREDPADVILVSGETLAAAGLPPEAATLVDTVQLSGRTELTDVHRLRDA